MIMAYITCNDKNEAKRIANHLLQKRLIACANIFPIESLYRWKGKLVKDKEVVLLAKSTENRFGTIQREVKKIHPYEVPCIEKIQSKANVDFENWVKGEVK